MKCPVTMYLICEVLKEAQTALSAREIARRGDVDQTSENLREIESECWDCVQSGFFVAYDLRKETKNPALFFQKVK